MDGIKHGARVLIDRTLEETIYVPTILVDITPDMRVNREEVFMPVISVTLPGDFAGALRIAYTGTSGCWWASSPQNLIRALMAFDEMDLGGVIVNEILNFRTGPMPYGGREGVH